MLLTKKRKQLKTWNAKVGYKTRIRCTCCGFSLCTEKRALWGGRSCWEVFHSQQQHIPSHPFSKPIKPVETDDGNSNLVVDEQVNRSVIIVSASAMKRRKLSSTHKNYSM
jgi:hypothetical protein